MNTKESVSIEDHSHGDEERERPHSVADGASCNNTTLVVQHKPGQSVSQSVSQSVRDGKNQRCALAR